MRRTINPRATSRDTACPRSFCRSAYPKSIQKSRKIYLNFLFPGLSLEIFVVLDTQILLSKIFYPIQSILINLVHPNTLLLFLPAVKYISVRPRERKWWIANFHEKISCIYKMNVSLYFTLQGMFYQKYKTVIVFRHINIINDHIRIFWWYFIKKIPKKFERGNFRIKLAVLPGNFSIILNK